MSDLESRLTRRALRSFAHASRVRLDAMEEGANAKRKARLDRAERHARRGYLEALHLSDLDA